MPDRRRRRPGSALQRESASSRGVRGRRVRGHWWAQIKKIKLLAVLGAVFQKSVLAFVVLGTMTLFILFALWSPYFRVRAIVVEPSMNLIPEEVLPVLEEFRGKNMLFLSETDVRAVLHENFPEFRTIELEEKWPRSLIIRAEVSPPRYNVFHEKTANFWLMTANGVLIDLGTRDGLPTVRLRQYDRPLDLRQRVLSEEQLRQIVLAEDLYLEKIGLDVSAVEWLYAAQELHLVSRGGMTVWIDLQESIVQQIEKLEQAADEIELYTEQFDHIDLRIPQQIFWESK